MKIFDKIFLLSIFTLNLVTFIDGDRLAFLIVAVFSLIYLVLLKLHTPTTLEKLIYILVLYLNAVAFILGFHANLEWFDNLTHILSTLAVTVYAAPFIYKTVLNPSSNISNELKILIMTTFGITVGVLWEIWEFYANIYVFEELGPTLHDIVTDLIYDSIGAFVGSIVVLFQARNEK